MNKAVLIFDMPNSCKECSLFGDYYADMYCKAMDNRTINYPYPKDFRQDWCPLKAIPEKDNKEYLIEWSRGYQSGWNDCVDAILGDNND